MLFCVSGKAGTDQPGPAPIEAVLGEGDSDSSDQSDAEAGNHQETSKPSLLRSLGRVLRRVRGWADNATRAGYSNMAVLHVNAPALGVTTRFNSSLQGVIAFESPITLADKAQMHMWGLLDKISLLTMNTPQAGLAAAILNMLNAERQAAGMLCNTLFRMFMYIYHGYAAPCY